MRVIHVSSALRLSGRMERNPMAGAGAEACRRQSRRTERGTVRCEEPGCLRLKKRRLVRQQPPVLVAEKDGNKSLVGGRTTTV